MTVPGRKITNPRWHFESNDIMPDTGGCAISITIMPWPRETRARAVASYLRDLADTLVKRAAPDEMTYADLYGHDENEMIDGDIAS